MVLSLRIPHRRVKSVHDVDMPGRQAGMANAPARGTTIPVASYVTRDRPRVRRGTCLTVNSAMGDYLIP